jgi:hypothetical protein
MSVSDNITSLKTLTRNLVEDTLRQIRSHRERHSPTNQGRYCIPEYLLEEALEYVSGAWDMILVDRPKAAVTLCRWVVEASLNLYWLVAGRKGEIDDRLKALCGEALRNEANLYEGLTKLWPDQADSFSIRACKARDVRKEDLGVEEKLQSLEQRLQNAKLPEQLYPLYRICSAAAHPGLNVWERVGADGSTGPGSPIDKYSACWMVAQSTLHLVVGAYILTELETGDKEVLKTWWKDKVGPLLDTVTWELKRGRS